MKKLYNKIISLCNNSNFITVGVCLLVSLCELLQLDAGVTQILTNVVFLILPVCGYLFSNTTNERNKFLNVVRSIECVINNYKAPLSGASFSQENECNLQNDKADAMIAEINQILCSAK